MVNANVNANAIFHPFSRLPPEIREQIWLFTGDHQIPTELFVRMKDRYLHIEDDHEREKALDESSELQYGTKPWPALWACREARKALQPLFIPPTSVHTPLPQWTNWDTIMVSCDDTMSIRRLADSPLGPKVVNITLLDGSPEFLLRPEVGESPFSIMTTEFENLQNIILLPWAAASWAEGEETVYFEEDWFRILKQLSWDTRHANGAMRLRTRVGGPDIPETQWLTSENFLQTKYLGYTVRGGEATEGCIDKDLLDRADKTWQDSDEISALEAPVFVDGDWELQQVEIITERLF